jgi:septum formation protein
MIVKSVILASGSPFRQQLLREVGLLFMSQIANVDESQINGLNPLDSARRRGEAKALAVALGHPGCLVIGADQTLSFEGRCLDKVPSAKEAVACLASLSGKQHELNSAYCIAYQPVGGVASIFVSRVISVPMVLRSLSMEEIEAYVATGEWEGSVGCYKIEKSGICLMKTVGGDSTAIIGLPMVPLLTDLLDLGINPLLNSNGPWTLDRE